MQNIQSINCSADLNILAVPSFDKIDFINLDDIFYLMADGRYTYLYLNDHSHKLSVKSIGDYESIIENPYFFRIHNSYIINLKHVISIDKAGGNYCLISNGKMLPISRRKNKELSIFLKIKATNSRI